jgi:hydroxymethylbilane synthase
VLAAAGLSRLGLAPEHARALPLAMMVPAPGQGCLAVQARDDDDDTIAALAPLDHAASHRALDAERSLMWRLGGGCALPLGARDVGMRRLADGGDRDGRWHHVLRAETEVRRRGRSPTAAKDLIAQGRAHPRRGRDRVRGSGPATR